MRRVYCWRESKNRLIYATYRGKELAFGLKYTSSKQLVHRSYGQTFLTGRREEDRRHNVTRSGRPEITYEWRSGTNAVRWHSVHHVDPDDLDVEMWSKTPEWDAHQVLSKFRVEVEENRLLVDGGEEGRKWPQPLPGAARKTTRSRRAGRSVGLDGPDWLGRPKYGSVHLFFSSPLFFSFLFFFYRFWFRLPNQVK